MRKKEEKAKLGRPKLADSKTKKKATIYIAIAFALLIAFTMGGIYSLYGTFSTNKLKGALKNSSSGCTVYASNIKATSADMYWSCTGSVRLNHFSVYYSNNVGAVGKKIINQRKLTTYTYGNSYSVSNLMSNSYFIFSIKLSDGNVINKLFKTPSSGTIAGDKKPTSYMNVSNITQNSAKVNWHLQACHAYNNTATLYKYVNSSWKVDKSLDAKGYNTTINLNNLSPGTKYKIVIKTQIGDSKTKGELSKTFTTLQVTTKPATTKTKQAVAQNTTKKTTAKTTKNNKYFTVRFNANGGVGSMNDQSIMHGNYNGNKLTPLSQNRFSKSGYKFVGWRAKRLVDGKWYGYNSSNAKGWYTESSVKKFYVYQNKQGVSRTVAPGDIVIMYAQWQAIPKTQSKTASKTCSSIKNQKDCTSSTQGEWKYSCIWRQNACYAGSAQAYKVVYNKNSRNATGTMSDQYITYGVNTKLRKNTFTLSGYKFAGWRAVNNKNGYVYGKNKDGKNGWYNSTDLKTVNFYKDQTTVSQTAAKGETVTMYAQWEVNSSQNNATNSTTFKIEKSSTKKNCFNVYAPKDAKYWRVHVYYKSSGASSYGTNKIYSKNHYNDGGKLQEVCFNKGYGDYRILVKKTTGSNDTASGSPSSWKPSGGSVNNSIGWAYKDYNGYNPK